VTKSWDEDRWIKTTGASYCGGGGAFRAGADLFGHGTDGGCALLPPSLLVDEQVGAGVPDRVCKGQRHCVRWFYDLFQKRTTQLTDAPGKNNTTRTRL